MSRLASFATATMTLAMVTSASLASRRLPVTDSTGTRGNLELHDIDQVLKVAGVTDSPVEVVRDKPIGTAVREHGECLAESRPHGAQLPAAIRQQDLLRLNAEVSFSTMWWVASGPIAPVDGLSAGVTVLSLHIHALGVIVSGI